MKNKQKKRLLVAVCILWAFVLWTAALFTVDRQPIGPQDSMVGFASVNRWFYALTGVHMILYTVTDWLSLVPIAFSAGFALLGLSQWIRRKGLMKVDRDILLLGGFYAVVFAAYLFFEEAAVNYRPVLINGNLEASYPSSTTLLVLCFMPTAGLQLSARIRNNSVKRIVLWSMTAFTVFMVIGRTVSGVHWLTDIIGGIQLSAGLVMLYCAAVFSGK